MMQVRIMGHRWIIGKFSVLHMLQEVLTCTVRPQFSKGWGTLSMGVVSLNPVECFKFLNVLLRQ